MLPQKEAVIMVTLRVSASSDPQRSSQRRSLGNASCPRSGANSTEGAMNRTAQRTRLCSQANPQAQAWWPELLGPGVRSPTVLEVSGLLVDPSTFTRPKEAGLG